LDNSSIKCARSSDSNFTRYSFITTDFTGNSSPLSAKLPGPSSRVRWQT
jgi:hypothetical protein